MSENEHKYGEATREYPVDGAPKHLKKDLKEGRAVDDSDEPETTSTQTPDPNVESVGDTLPAADTAAGTTTTVTDSGATTTTSGTPSTTTAPRTRTAGRSAKNS